MNDSNATHFIQYEDGVIRTGRIDGELFEFSFSGALVKITNLKSFGYEPQPIPQIKKTPS